ncbi:MAG: hypothetical protein ABIK65_03965 [Candidatus Eisenbacteria bacterium]
MADETSGLFQNPSADVPRAQQRIRALDGVVSCGIVATPRGEIREIHVVSSGARPPKPIIRDIESTLYAEFGVRFDHRRVSIATLKDEPDSAEGEPAAVVEEIGPLADSGPGRRLRFLGLRTGLTPEGGDVEVILSRGNFRGFGKASFFFAFEPERAVAEATLEAVGKFVRSGGFRLGEVRRERMGDEDVVLARVLRVEADRTFALVGSAIVRRDRNLAALHAVLDAVNRIVGRLTPVEGIEIVAVPDRPAS